jgi:hypothetical protein
LLIPCRFCVLTKIILPPIQNIIGIYKQITILIFYQVSYRLVTLRLCRGEGLQIWSVNAHNKQWKKSQHGAILQLGGWVEEQHTIKTGYVMKCYTGPGIWTDYLE